MARLLRFGMNVALLDVDMWVTDDIYKYFKSGTLAEGNWFCGDEGSYGPLGCNGGARYTARFKSRVLVLDPSALVNPMSLALSCSEPHSPHFTLNPMKWYCMLMLYIQCSVYFLHPQSTITRQCFISVVEIERVDYMVCAAPQV